MKKIKVALFLFYFTFLVSNSFAQVNNTISPKHSHPEYEKKIQEMKSREDKADQTYQKAQDMFDITKEHVKNIETDQRNFLAFFAALLTITFGGAVVATIASFKAIKNSYENKFKENYEKIAEKNSETIKSMIAKEDWSTKIRNEKEILVLNKEGTGISSEFLSVISAFKKYKFENIKELKDSLEKDYSGYDLVIIENCDDKGYWKLTHEYKDSEKNIKVKTKFDAETQEIADVNNIFKNLGNKICPVTALIYYGKQSKGNFPSDKVDEQKRHMISYANTPSTLFGNMIDLLRYKDIIENHQTF